jgi:hypothetical protein
MPAAPQTIFTTVGATWQDARFAVLSSGFIEKAPNALAAFLKVGRGAARSPAVSQIRIFPGPLNLFMKRSIANNCSLFES